MHENGALFGGGASGGGQHPAGNMTQLHQILPVRGIFASVFIPRKRLLRGIMQTRTDTPGKVKGPADTDRPDRIQLVGVINQLVDQRHRTVLAPEAMTANRVCNDLNQRFIHASADAEKVGGLAVSRLRMADSAFRPQFLRTRHIVQQRRQRHRQKRSGIRRIKFLTGKELHIPQNTFRMVEIMTAGRIAQLRADRIPDSKI